MDLIETRTGAEAPNEVTDGVLYAQEAEDVAAQAEVVGSEVDDAASAQEDAASELDAMASEGEVGTEEAAETTSDGEAVVSEEEMVPSEPEEVFASQKEVAAESEDDPSEPEGDDSEPKSAVAEADKSEMGGHPMADWDYEEPRRGQVRVGVILSIQEQEIIVDVGAKRDGIVPSSDLQRLDPEALAELEVGQEVPVYILRTEDQDGNLLVSLNMARQEKAWLRAKELSESGEVIEDRVIGYNKGGLVIPVGEIRGFVPASQVPGFPHGLSQEDRIQRLSDMVGKKLQVKVIEINRRKRRLILSATAAQRLWRKQQRERLLAELREGEVRKGVVSSLCAFGAFVDLGGADGLVHLSELSWRRVRHPREVLKVGDEIEVYVLRLDQEKNRIGLSLKRLQPEPWALVEDKYELGQLVEGVVTNVVDFGAFAEIEDGVEGLIHVSELAEGQISHPRDVVKKGDLLLLRIIRIDTRRKRLGLSLKRVLESEWAEWAAALAVAEAEAAEAAAAEAAAAETTVVGEAIEADVPEEAVAEGSVAEVVEEAEEAAEAPAEETTTAEPTVADAGDAEVAAAEIAAADAGDAEVAAAGIAVADAGEAEVAAAGIAVADAGEADAADAEVAVADAGDAEVAAAGIAVADAGEADAADAEVAVAAVVASEAEDVEAEVSEAVIAVAVPEEVVSEAESAETEVEEGVAEEVVQAEIAEEEEALAPTEVAVVVDEATRAEEATAEAEDAKAAAAEPAGIEGVEEPEEPSGELPLEVASVEGADEPPVAELGESEVENETIESPELDIVDA
jgi:small subunit ribosomal protein S1